MDVVGLTDDTIESYTLYSNIKELSHTRYIVIESYILYSN